MSERISSIVLDRFDIVSAKYVTIAASGWPQIAIICGYSVIWSRDLLMYMQWQLGPFSEQGAAMPRSGQSTDCAKEEV